MKNIKEIVKQKYSLIAKQNDTSSQSSCCGTSSDCCGVDYTVFSESYKNIQGYNTDADLGLGCGLPTEYVRIKRGYTVIDLGSGAGNDCFVAREIVGEDGKVIGIDMTEAMIKKAEENTKKLGFTNVTFRLGDIEEMPAEDNEAHVVISNCVLNLVPDKKKAFSQIYRVLLPGGHFSISDVVLEGHLPVELAKDAEMYAGCVSGAIQKSEYLKIIEDEGFKNISVQKQKQVVLPDDVLLKYLNQTQLEEYKNSGKGIYSITVYAEKHFSCCSG